MGTFGQENTTLVVKGIQLITLYSTERSGKSVPVNYRIYNKQESQTKNDYLRGMITEVLGWGLQPLMVTSDAWYSSGDNLKLLKDKELGFLIGIAKNRKVAINSGEYTQVQALKIPDEGLLVYLKKFGYVKVFRRTFKNEVDRYYIMYLPEHDATEQFTRTQFKEFHSIHWGIECASQSPERKCVALSDLW